MELAQASEIKEALELFLEVFDKYHDEIISESPQRSRLNELRRQLQKEEPQITHHILNILGNNTVVIGSYGSQATIPFANLLATALMGGNNELRHNFGGFYAPVTSILNRAIGNIDAGLWPQKKQEQENKSGKVTTMKTPDISTDRKKVFVVHGRNEKAREAIFTFLRSIGLEPIEWLEAIKLTRQASPYIGQVLDAAFSHACAIVVLFTGDDLARLGTTFTQANESDEQLTPQARPNVIFEAGLSFGRNLDRTVLVQLGKLRGMSDLAGRHMIIMDNTVEKRQALASRLKTAGCEVMIEDRTDWHTTGDFEGAITYPDKQKNSDGNVSIGNSTGHSQFKASPVSSVFLKLENMMPKLISEMREDLANHPLSREFVILKKGTIYYASGHELCYYYDDHPELDNCLNILLNYGLITEIPKGNVPHYIISEELAGYLTSKFK